MIEDNRFPGLITDESGTTVRPVSGFKLGLRMAGIVVAVIGLVCVAIIAVIAVVWLMALWGHYIHVILVDGFRKMDRDTRCFSSGAVLAGLVAWWLQPNYRDDIRRLEAEVIRSRSEFKAWAEGE